MTKRNPRTAHADAAPDAANETSPNGNGNGARQFQFAKRNLRLHGQRNKSLVRASLEEVGAFRSIGVDGDGIVQAGNTTYEQALALGLKIKPVEAAPDELVAVIRKDLKGKKAERAGLLDNRSQELSEPNAALITELANAEAELLEGLYTADELLELEAQAQMGWDDENANGYGAMRDEQARAKFVELVIEMDSHELVERAISKARSLYACGRGEALVHICEAFL